jgi:predicted PurR-regulated permease PerM
MLEKRTIDISTGIIFRTVLILLGIWFLYVIRDIVAIFFIALIVTAAIEPTVNWMNRNKIPRSLAVLIIYIVLLLVIGAVIYLMVPPFIAQFKDFSQNLPFYIERITRLFKGLESYAQSYNFNFGTQNILEDLGNNLTHSPATLFSTTIGVFSGFISMVVVMSLTFYMSVKKDGMKNFVVAVTPLKYQDYAVSVVERIKLKIGRWVQGQLFLMFSIFILDFLALYFLKVPYVLILAILGGLLEIIPYIGPTISAVPATILGFFVSPLTGIMTAAVYILIHQAEGHIIAPQVMKKAVGLNPIVVILVLLIGAKVAGVLGAVLSVPITTVLSVFVDDIVEKRSE